MSANRLRLQGSINEETRTDEHDVNGLLLGFHQALLREAAESAVKRETERKESARAASEDQAAGASE